MFEKYNLDELYVGSIDVKYSDDHGFDTNIGGIFMMGDSGYGYYTVLVKTDCDRFIDLQNPSRLISTVRNQGTTSYILSYVEPLSNYYKRNGRKIIFTREQAANEARKHYHASNLKKQGLIK